MKIMFWNTHNNKDINEYLKSLVNDYRIDTLVLAEYNGKYDALENLLKETGQILRRCFTDPCKRLHILSTYSDVRPSSQDTYYSIHIFQKRFVLCGVHLMSNLRGDYSVERRKKAEIIKHDIEDAGKLMGTDRFMIIGDFNAMPYSHECLGADGFHGLPTLNMSEQPERMVSGEVYTKYYNPMWNLFGDYLHPPGTYYTSASRMVTPRWFMLDQIILSKGIIPHFVKDSLKIITDCSLGSLMSKNGRPNKKISDHFPIMCEITDENKMED